ncbi:MAG TPA: AIR synthase-related protein [Acidimicrobiales bacterium]|nr:AIR synthase-related protein [Acidimicrobiales bacterium]
MEATPLPVGKVPADLLGRVLSRFGPLPAEVHLGPALGEDACAIRVPAGLLVAATDPITLTAGDAARLAVIVNANDVAVMGVRPRWFLAAVLLPPGTTAAAVEELFGALDRALVSVGACLVGGHTEVSTAVVRPVIVGQMLGVAETGRVVATGGARAGDVVVQVGPAPVEGSAVLAVEKASELRGLEPTTLAAAAHAASVPGISVVEAALIAAELGATSLHDPTEGGLASGLHELARSSSVALFVDMGAVLWFPPGIAVCRALGADPWATLASGALLAAFAPDAAAHAVDVLTQRGHPAAVIGRAEPGRGVRATTGEVIPLPPRDEVARILGA